MPKFFNNAHWLYYQNENIQLDDSSGKLIAYIRCTTTEQERFDFFQHLTLLLEQNYSLPVSGKIATRINENNLCAFLFYCNDNQQHILKNALKNIKPLLDHKYQSWFYKCPDQKILTWNWRWKSDQQTLSEIENKTHWTYRAGLRKK